MIASRTETRPLEHTCSDQRHSACQVGDDQWLTFYAILAANGALAFFVNLSNFLVTRYTSALTLQVGSRFCTNRQRMPASM